jgi:hypothetical protein
MPTPPFLRARLPFPGTQRRYKAASARPAGNPATIDAPLAGHRQGNPRPATTGRPDPGAETAPAQPHHQHRSPGHGRPGSRPIRGIDFARLAELPALGFGARFAQLAANGSPPRCLHKT